LADVAGVRAHYDTLVAQARRRSDILAEVQSDLADARSSLAAAESTSLISRVDEPRTGNYPVGPRRAYIVAGGFAGGLFVGLGLLFLIVPISDVTPADGAAEIRDVCRSRREASPRPGRDAATDAGAPPLSIGEALFEIAGRRPSRI
jgi:hypothetical protein